MSKTAAAYARMLKALLPPGRLFRLESDGLLGKILLGAADELVRIDGRADDLQAEADPRTADDLLPEFEADLGIIAEGTDAARRNRIVARLLARQRFRPVDFQQALAPLLGQAAGDVVVIERGRAFAVLTGDDRSIYAFYIYRDPAEPGTYDLETAQTLVDSMAPAHTKGKVIESRAFKCDDAHSLCDRDLLGV